MKFKLGDKVRILDGSNIEGYTQGWTSGMALHVGEIYKIKDVDTLLYNDGRYAYKLENVPYWWDERGLELVIKNEFKPGQIYQVTSGTSENGSIIKITSVSDFNDKDNCYIVRYDTIKGIKGRHPQFKSGSLFARSLKLISDEMIVIYRQDQQVIAFNEKTSKTGIARCCSEDTFDFSISAKLALDRLIESEPEPRELLNTKVVFNESDDFLTAGKIYDIVDGKITCDDGTHIPLKPVFHNMNEVKVYFGDKNTGGLDDLWWSPDSPKEVMEIIS